MNHVDQRLQKIIRRGYDYLHAQQSLVSGVQRVLLHKDATPSNTLCRGSAVSLIDWEFSRYGDPMVDFSTIFYEDMEYGKGKWRIKITFEEKTAIFNGYTQDGGVIDYRRLAMWTIQDKLGCMTFLYWRLYQSSRPATGEQKNQYRLDLDNLMLSLEKVLL